MKIEIIQAGKENFDEIVNIFNQYRVFYEQKDDIKACKSFIQKRLEKEDSMIFLAISKNKAVGYMQLYPSFSSVAVQRSWILNDLFVVPEARRSGVGKLLLQKAKDLAISTNAKRISLNTAADNKTAQSLYESAGYKKDPFIYYKLEFD